MLRSLGARISMPEITSSSTERRRVFRPRKYRIFRFGQLQDLTILEIVRLHANITACSECFVWFVVELLYMSDFDQEIKIPMLHNMVPLYRDLLQHWNDEPNNRNHCPQLHLYYLRAINQFYIDNALEFQFDFPSTFAEFYQGLVQTFVECQCGTHSDTEQLVER